MHSLLCDVIVRNVSYVSLSEPKVSADIYNRWAQLYIDPALSVHQSDSVYLLSEPHPFFPPNLPLKKGSDWFIFTRLFVQDILTSSDARSLLAYFANTLSPSESYFATFLVYSPHSFVNDNLRFMVWTYSNGTSGQHPLFLNAALHWQALRRSGALFARKLSPRSSLVSMIDEAMEEKGNIERVTARLAKQTLSREEFLAMNWLPT